LIDVPRWTNAEKSCGHGDEARVRKKQTTLFATAAFSRRSSISEKIGAAKKSPASLEFISQRAMVIDKLRDG
jgi:hypothetical protein